MRRDIPYPKNAPGPFIVCANECIICRAPEHEAPDLMTHDEGEDDHCYFHRQPSTPEEIDQACRAVLASCCGAVKYVGDDPSVLHRLSVLSGAIEDTGETVRKSRPWWRFW